MSHNSFIECTRINTIFYACLLLKEINNFPVYLIMIITALKVVILPTVVKLPNFTPSGLKDFSTFLQYGLVFRRFHAESVLT